MEGVLWKWTNYWNGWQTRWFVLENGILSYFKSQEDLDKGCKGSIKVSACEINVDSLDPTRLDLNIPGEQHLYLKAATSQERQQWLVALGTAKACVQSRNSKENGIVEYLYELFDDYPNYLKISNIDMPPVGDSLFCLFISESGPDTLKTKRSELRLYCDLLMQQVHMVKTAANAKEGPEIDRIDEATSLLTATCDTFIKTLEDCMKLSNANLVYDVTPCTMINSPPINSNLTYKKVLKLPSRTVSADT